MRDSLHSPYRSAMCNAHTCEVRERQGCVDIDSRCCQRLSHAQQQADSKAAKVAEVHIHAALMRSQAYAETFSVQLTMHRQTLK